VIPRWISAFLSGDAPAINGDGGTTRDFCFIENVIQANLLAATAMDSDAMNQVYNVAFGERTSLNQLFSIIRDELAAHAPHVAGIEPVYAPFRQGDVRHSLADIRKARQLLGYAPAHSILTGMREYVRWYVSRPTAVPPQDRRVAAAR
jgi:UDP-N-acetylglucosamine 4-epimerase